MKKMIVNCATCDMRTVSEETLQSYEQIVVNAATVILTARTKELLNRHDVMLNAAEVMEVLEGSNVRLNNQNGSYELTGDGMPQEGEIALLMVNGSLTIGTDALEAARAYEKIKVNGYVLMPKSMAGKLTNLSVNGSTDLYPDGAVRLRRNAVVDKTFPLRIRENALYWAARRLVFTDPALNVEKLAQKGVRFAAPKALLAESLAEAVTPLLDEDTDILVVPDGTQFVNGYAKVNKRFLKKYGPRLYVNGDLIVESDAAEVLPKIEYLYVNGQAKVPADLVDAFEEIDAQYDELKVVRAWGKIIEDQTRVKVDRALLEKYPTGVLVTDCVQVKLAADLTPEMIMDRLSLADCVQVYCTEEQEAAVGAVAEGVVSINPAGDDMGVADMVTGSLGMNPDLKVINAAEYVM